MASKRSSQKPIYYKIGEACKLLDIEPYVLRYWETEFPDLSPNKSKSGQRVYGEKEIELIRRIKYLVRDEGYTIAGAKKKLEQLAENGDEETGEVVVQLDSEAIERLQTVRQELGGLLEEAREILALLAPRSS